MPANYQFVDDVTIPDDMAIATGVPFVKTWLVRNIGDTAWGEGYTLRFEEGVAMTNEKTVPLPACDPGEIVELSLDLTVPTTTGTHWGDWYFYDNADNRFGEVIYLRIVAKTPAEIGNGELGAKYVADVTIPDDTIIALGESFTKTWRIRNTGNVAWSPGYKFVYVNGQTMGTHQTMDLPAAAVGDTTDVSITFTAPEAPGVAFSDWRCQSPMGTIFGDTFYVRIKAEGNSQAASGGRISDSTAVRDVTVPDDTQMQAGNRFKKTWLARNTGTKAWDSTYTLRNIKGNPMSEATSYPLPVVQPNEEAQLSVVMTAPQQGGTHYGDWKMFDPNGNPFGDIFWARIKVPGSTGSGSSGSGSTGSGSGSSGGGTVTVTANPFDNVQLQSDAPFFSQRNPSWGKNKLGNSPSITIEMWGCMMSCNAMILADFGIDTDPGRLNSYLHNNGLYWNGYITQWNTATLVNGNVKFDGVLKLGQVDSTVTQRIDSYLNRGLPVMVNVDTNPSNSYNSNMEQHWVLIVSKYNDDYLINDPAEMDSGVISLMDKYGYSGQPIWKAIQQVVFYSY